MSIPKVFIVEDSTNATLRAVFADRTSAEDFAHQVKGSIVYERTVRTMAPASHRLSEVSDMAAWPIANGHTDLANELAMREAKWHVDREQNEARRKALGL